MNQEAWIRGYLAARPTATREDAEKAYRFDMAMFATIIRRDYPPDK